MGRRGKEEGGKELERLDPVPQILLDRLECEGTGRAWERERWREK
jgi:hypothetical protein